MNRLFSLVLSMSLVFALVNLAQAAEEVTIPLTITGGHDTDPRDHGRPVILVGNALGVTPEIFRAAFSHVKPAQAGAQPDPAQVQRNKAALLGALSRYGVDNDLLDRVSTYYRYRRESGRLWRNTPAVAAVSLMDGAVVSVKIIDAGSGYSSPPIISVPGHPEILLKATLSFGRDLKTNGSISAIAARG